MFRSGGSRVATPGRGRRVLPAFDTASAVVLGHGYGRTEVPHDRHASAHLVAGGGFGVRAVLDLYATGVIRDREAFENGVVLNLHARTATAARGVHVDIQSAAYVVPLDLNPLGVGVAGHG